MKNYTTNSYQKNKILIPEIEKKIERKIKELKLNPEISIKKFLLYHKTGKHRYLSPCYNKEGKKIAFYVRLHNNLDASQKFIREIKFLKKVKKRNLEIKKIIPKLIDYGIEKDFEWFKREYSDLTPLGHSRKAFSPLSLSVLKKIVKSVLEISKINPRKFPEIKLKKFNVKNYFASKVYEDLVKKKVISKEISKKMSEKIKKTLPLLEKENHYFCHGDLNLGNILSDQKEIQIIDWELINLNNFAYDIGYLWAHLWEVKKSLRNKFMEIYLKNLDSPSLAKFKKLLPIIASYLSLGGIGFKKEKEKKESFKRRKRFYAELLRNSLEDFNKLIKT